MNKLLHCIGHRMSRILQKPLPGFVSAVSGHIDGEWVSWIHPGDVLLIEGNSRVSTSIKYLTQSTWSHACLVAGDRCAIGPLIEATMDQGIIASPCEKYLHTNVRICRPKGLTDSELGIVVDAALDQLGHQYNLQNLFDLMRYFVPMPFPAHRRRRMLTFGSGDPTRAICSSLIAQAFDVVKYPIMPLSWHDLSGDSPAGEILYHARAFGAYTPRDFDLSPYFDVVKPTLESEFDFHRMHWDSREDPMTDA